MELTTEPDNVERDFQNEIRRARETARRVALSEIASGTFVAFVTATLAAVVVMGFVPFSDGLRALLIGFVVTLVVGATGVLWRAKWTPLSENTRVATLLEDAARRRGMTLEGDVVGAVEMLTDVADSTSPALVRAHVQATLHGLHHAGAHTALSTVALHAARRTFASLGIAVIVLVMVQLLFADVMRDRIMRLLDGERARQAALEADKNRPPLVTDVGLTLRYPRYMARPERKLVGVSGDVTVPRGTEIIVEGRADEPLSSAALLVGAQEIALAVTDGRALKGTFVLDEAGTYRFRVTNVDGREALDPVARRIILEPDAIPTVTMTEPKEDRVVQVDESIPVVFQGQDDHGLSRFRLVVVRQGTGQASTGKDLLVTDVSPRELSGKGSFRPDELGGRPGDRLSVYVEAFDNDTVGGPKSGRSVTRVLTVFSAAEHHRSLIDKEEALKDALVDLLASALENPIDADLKKEDDRKRTIESQSRVANEANDVIVALDALLLELARDALSPDDVRRALANMRTGLDRIARNLVDLTSGARNAMAANRTILPYVFNHLRTYRKELVADLERHILYLDDLLSAQRLDEAKSLTDELKRTQEALKALLEKYKASPDDETRAAILEEIKRLKEQMSAIQERLAEIDRDIPDEHLNAEAFMSDEMLSEASDLEDMVEQGRIDDALAALEQMMEGTEKLDSEIAESQEEFGDDEYREVREKMREFTDELSSIRAAQEEMANRSERMFDAARKEAMKDLDDKLKSVLEKLIEKTKAANKALKKIDSRGLYAPEQEEAAFAIARVEDLERALQAKDLEDALDAAREALDSIEITERQVTERTRGRFASGNERTKDAAQRLETSRPLVADVKETLEEIMPDPSAMLDAQQKSQMSKDAKSQAELKERTDKLVEKMKEIGGELPLFGPSHEATMGKASSSMRDAARQLQRDDLRQGRRAQGEALQSLQELEGALEEMGKSGGKGGIPMPLPQGGSERGQREGDGRRPTGEEVEIPGAEDFEAPEEFRREILEAMREDAPPAFMEEVKRYYEELIK